ncbi:MAG: hypothetical protein IJ999_02685 [Clostridia bacterium]|nr:hypothetical protein [Clostridia bacterium]
MSVEILFIIIHALFVALMAFHRLLFIWHPIYDFKPKYKKLKKKLTLIMLFTLVINLAIFFFASNLDAMIAVFFFGLILGLVVVCMSLKGANRAYSSKLKQRLLEIDNVENMEYHEIRRILWEKYFDAGYSVEEIKTALKEMNK